MKTLYTYESKYYHEGHLFSIRHSVFRLDLRRIFPVLALPGPRQAAHWLGTHGAPLYL